MSIKHIRINNFRCLEVISLEFDHRRNYFFGSNGSGKTSLLESIYFLGKGRSFRTRQANKLVMYGHDSFSIFANTHGGNSLSLGAEFSQGSLKRQINGDYKIKPLDSALSLPVYVLDPNSHFLIEGGPSKRRQFIDWGVFHVEPDYLEYWKEYRRALSQRNAAIKRGDNFRIWDQSYIDAGNKVNHSRSTYIEKLKKQLDKIDLDLIKKRISIAYFKGWDETLTFEQAVSSSATRDKVSGISQVGPHRADMIIKFDAKGTKENVSRGQQKLITIALTLSQVNIFFEITKIESLLLIDDLAAELDLGSLQSFFSLLDKVPAQVFITGLSKNYLPIKNEKYPMFHVEQGNVELIDLSHDFN